MYSKITLDNFFIIFINRNAIIKKYIMQKYWSYMYITMINQLLLNIIVVQYIIYGRSTIQMIITIIGILIEECIIVIWSSPHLNTYFMLPCYIKNIWKSVELLFRVQVIIKLISHEIFVFILNLSWKSILLRKLSWQINDYILCRLY